MGVYGHSTAKLDEEFCTDLIRVPPRAWTSLLSLQLYEMG
jgi:hypothetical protein